MVGRNTSSGGQKFPRGLWLRHPGYRAYMLREVTSFFIAAYTVIYILQLLQLSSGPQGYTALLETMASPGIVALTLVLLAFAVYHTISWIVLAAKVQRVRVGKGFAPQSAVVAGGIALWLAISILLAVFVYG